MTWRVARSLDQLLAQLNTLAPNRSKASDGSIGDAAHQAQGSASDHNAWYVLNGQALVTARDFTHDPANGLDCHKLASALMNSRDPRIKYMIWQGRIMDSRPQFHPWTWTPSSGHYQHLHLSVMANPSADDARVWSLPGMGGQPVYTVPAWPLPRGHYFGNITGPLESHGGFHDWERVHITRIQRALIRKGFVPGVANEYGGWADGKYEMATVEAVKRFQQREMPGTTRFGEVWADDWQSLLR